MLNVLVSYQLFVLNIGGMADVVLLVETIGLGFINQHFQSYYIKTIAMPTE